MEKKEWKTDDSQEVAPAAAADLLTDHVELHSAATSQRLVTNQWDRSNQTLTSSQTDPPACYQYNREVPSGPSMGESSAGAPKVF